jgi:Domain of unknown function (DUF4845)
MVMTAMVCRQRGVGFVGFIGIAAGVIFVAILGMKMVPPYVHSAQISQILRTIAGDPALKDASVRDIRDAFTKRADINYITDIKGEDIEVSKEDGVLSLSAQYSVKIPLVGNVSMVLEFNPSSS